MTSPPSRMVVQLSDPHVVEPGKRCGGAVDTAAFLRRAVATIASLEPAADLVLCTGDLVENGRVSQYEHLRELLRPLTAPYRLLCGNHDDRTALRRSFPDHRYLGDDGPCDWMSDELAPLRIVALDTLRPGRPGGALGAAQLGWLDDRLAEAPDRPAIVALHHPPFPTGIGHMDAMGLDPTSAAGLADVVARHPQVERVLAGHLHRSITRRFAGTIATTAPSSAHAVALDLRDGTPTGAWTTEPPAVLVHHWTAANGLVTHVLPTGVHPPRRFDG